MSRLLKNSPLHGISNLTGKLLKNVKQSAVSDYLLHCNCAINFDDVIILATDSNKFKLLLRESLFIKCEKPFFKQDDKIISIGNLWLRWQFLSNVTWLSGLLLIFERNFIVCIVRARICFKCYVKEKRNCSFENALVEKSENSTNLK